MAVTAIDMQKASGNNVLRRAYIEDLRKASPVVDLLKWETTNALNVQAFRWLSLPAVGFRAANASFSEATGKTEQIAASVYDLGKYADVDRLYVRDKSVIENPRKTQDKMTAKAMAITMLDQMINGDGATDPNGFDGLKVQISGLASSQIIDGASLDISTTANRATNGFAFMTLVDTLIDSCEGMPDALLMSRVTRRAFADIARQKAMWNQSKDQMGRMVDRYGEIPIMTMGYKLDQSTEIISTSFDGSAGITSIFAVKFGTDDFVMLQEYPLEVTDHGLLQTKSVYRTEASWPIGTMLRSKYAAARLKAIKIA